MSLTPTHTHLSAFHLCILSPTLSSVSGSPHIFIPSVYPVIHPKLCVWLPADTSLQRFAAVLAGSTLRQLTPEQLSTLLTLLQLLPKGTGRNPGECPCREGSNPLLHEAFCPGGSQGENFLVFIFLEMGSLP